MADFVENLNEERKASRFDEFSAALVQYKQEKGSLGMKRDYTTPEGLKLGAWLASKYRTAGVSFRANCARFYLGDSPVSTRALGCLRKATWSRRSAGSCRRTVTRRCEKYSRSSVGISTRIPRTAVLSAGAAGAAGAVEGT